MMVQANCDVEVDQPGFTVRRHWPGGSSRWVGTRALWRWPIFFLL